MPTLERIQRDKEEFARRQEELFQKVSQIKLNETPEQTSRRRSMGLNWSEFPVLLKAKWHIDYCWNDGGKLMDAELGRFESGYVGGMDLGVRFIAGYRTQMIEHSVHVGQCPKCKLLYLLPPSPEDLESRRKHRDVPYVGKT